MSASIPDSVQRTLIVTCGPLAHAAGESFVERLVKREGPEAAIGVVAGDVAGVATENGLDTAVSEALTRISPPDLAALLSHQGWRLTNPAELTLILLLDAVPGGGDMAATLAEQTTAVIYRHLGVESTSLLIWLVGETGEGVISACLPVLETMTRGTAVLGMCNEAGLRLADETTLSHIAAELLWCLTATPLRDLPEQMATQNSQAYIGAASLFTLGLFGWAWSPTAIHAAFMQRWLDGVFAHWLSQTEVTVAPPELATWLTAQQLGLDDFVAHILKEEERQLPHFPGEAWRMPWPWEIEALMTNTLFAAAVDEESLNTYQQYACLRLAEPLQRATAVLQEQARGILDGNPVGGISDACTWLEAMMTECDRLVEQTLDEEEALIEGITMLAAERGRVETSLKNRLAVWPSAHWQSWAAVMFRPWRWPDLAWRYGRLRQAGQQLSYILTRQAALKRQVIANRTTRQAMSELRQVTRRVYGQVEEIGQMLQSLAGEFTSQANINPTAVGHDQYPVFTLPLLPTLYDELIPDAAAEAAAAAGALGGLGRQVTALNEAIGEALRRLGAQRLAGVWQLTTVDALMAWVDDQAQMQARWQEAWEAARPLWRVDEARLGEAMRFQSSRITAVCGADAHLLANLLPELDGPVTWLESGDRERLWLVRIRAGIATE